MDWWSTRYVTVFQEEVHFVSFEFSPKSRLVAAGVGGEATSSSDNYARTLIPNDGDEDDRQIKIIVQITTL